MRRYQFGNSRTTDDIFYCCAIDTKQERGMTFQHLEGISDDELLLLDAFAERPELLNDIRFLDGRCMTEPVDRFSRVRGNCFTETIVNKSTDTVTVCPFTDNTVIKIPDGDGRFEYGAVVVDNSYSKTVALDTDRPAVIKDLRIKNCSEVTVFPYKKQHMIDIHIGVKSLYGTDDLQIRQGIRVHIRELDSGEKITYFGSKCSISYLVYGYDEIDMDYVYYLLTKISLDRLVLTGSHAVNTESFIPNMTGMAGRHGKRRLRIKSTEVIQQILDTFTVMEEDDLDMMIGDVILVIDITEDTADYLRDTCFGSHVTYCMNNDRVYAVEVTVFGDVNSIKIYSMI